jgi:hypothetical protein
MHIGRLNEVTGAVTICNALVTVQIYLKSNKTNVLHGMIPVATHQERHANDTLYD